MSDLPPQLHPDIAIQDAVHGRIWLTRLEKHVIDTPEFQRLRSIGQLGLGYYVFPSADHSRFVHSIGAAHITGWMLTQHALQSYFSERPELVQCLRLAALLHDVGHYPFSHLGENVWGAAAGGAIDLYSSEGADRSLYDVAAQVARDKRTSHEAVTAEVIQRSRIHEIVDAELGTVDGKQASEIVVGIIDGSYPDVVCQNLVSSDLDCDRLDYLIRDSMAAGLTYGLIDLAYLIENLRVAEHERHGWMLAVDKAHGSEAVEHYVLARYYHYAQFITHKTVAAAELILAAAILELIRLEKLPTADEVLSRVGSESFRVLTDHSVWNLLGEALIEDWASDELREASSRLVNRDLVKVAFGIEALEVEGEVPSSSDRLDYLFATPARKADSASKADVSANRFCYKKSVLALVGIAGKATPTEFIEDTEKIETRWVKSVKVAEPDGTPELLVEQKGLLRDLSLRRWVTRRLFVREERAQPEKEERPTAEKLRNFVDRELAA